MGVGEQPPQQAKNGLAGDPGQGSGMGAMYGATRLASLADRDSRSVLRKDGSVMTARVRTAAPESSAPQSLIPDPQSLGFSK
jgi:hypothetical protein